MTDPIKRMLEYQQQAGHFPGALVHVEQDGKPVSRIAFGRLHSEKEEPISDQARFRIASLTKGMVSMVALCLVDRKALDLQVPVGEYLPELRDMTCISGPPTRSPTLRDLLSHTAGFGNIGETSDPAIRARAAQHPIEGKLALMTREQFLNTLAQRPLTAQPGTRFQYGFSTDLVGLIIERVFGGSLQAAMQEVMFEPLGMTNTSFRVSPAEHADMPSAFGTDKSWHDFVATFNKADQIAAEQKLSTDTLQGLLHSGGGGLVSTLDDIAAYARMLANGGAVTAGSSSQLQRIVSQPLFEQAMTNQLGPTVPGPHNFTGGGFGFGLAGAIRNEWAPAAVPAQPGEFAWSGVTGHTLYVKPGGGWFALMLSSNTASRVIVRLEFRRAVAMLAT